MKIAYFASVLAMTTAVAVACNDNADRVTPRHVSATAGTASTAGKSGNTAGSSTGDGGKGGGSGGSNVAGTSGAPDQGGAGGDNVGGEPSAAGAGEAGAAGNGAGAGGDGSVAPAPLELIGSYDDYFGDTVFGSFTITQDAWGSSAVAAYDNAANVVYTQYPADDMYNPSKFAKTVYTDFANNSFYYCSVVYSAATLAEAQASTATADASDPESGGCATFPWSKAKKK